MAPADLDGDGVPETVTDAPYTGSACCCSARSRRQLRKAYRAPWWAPNLRPSLPDRPCLGDRYYGK